MFCCKDLLAYAGREGTERSALGMAAAMEDDREAFGAQKQAQAAERKSWQKEQREALDEMLPKATGRWLLVLTPTFTAPPEGVGAESCMGKSAGYALCPAVLF